MAAALADDLFRQHSRMVLGVCRRLLPDPLEAEDAMQETFASAYRSLLTGSEPRRADVWLAAIARNECVDRIRARMREPLARQPRNGGPDAPDALAAVIAGEDLRALSRSIEQLPAQQRDALLMHEFCGLPYEQVANALGVSESAIGSLLFRARRSVRSAFRRTYALLPLPDLWNTLAQLFTRGPAIKVAALPVVAKVGAGAVAVGLTAGAVVAVEHEVGTKSGSRSLPTRVSVASLPETRARVADARPVWSGSMHAIAAAAAATSVMPRRPRPPAPPKAARRAVPAPHAATIHPVSAPAARSVMPTSAPSPEAPAVESAAARETGKAGWAPGHGRLAHASVARRNAGKGHGDGKPAARTPSPKHPEKQEPARHGSNRSAAKATKPAGASPAAAPPESAGALDQHGPKDDRIVEDASSSSSDPGSSTKDQPEHPVHPEHPVKS